RGSGQVPINKGGVHKLRPRPVAAIAVACSGRFWFSLPRQPGCDTLSRLFGAIPFPSSYVSLMGMTDSTSGSPMQKLAQVMRHHGLVRFVEHFAELFPTTHLKDLVVDEAGPNRLIRVGGHRVVNFGSDSFLGLDQDPRVQQAIVRGVERWGTHNGASRAFSCVRANAEAEDRIAAWLGTKAALIYGSVTLANLGAI